jgi:hypothetical protein
MYRNPEENDTKAIHTKYSALQAMADSLRAQTSKHSITS